MSARRTTSFVVSPNLIGATPHAGSHDHVEAAQHERHPRRLDEPLSQLQDLAIAVAIDQHGILVAAEASEHVHEFQLGGQTGGELDEHLISGLVPERVVDFLEAIEVEH